VVGLGLAAVVAWLLWPYLWAWRYEGELDSSDPAVRERAAARVVATPDGRVRELVAATMQRWLAGDDDRRFDVAFRVLNGLGRLAASAERPALHVRSIRIRYARAAPEARAAVLGALDPLFRVDLPQIRTLLEQAARDESQAVRGQAIWSALRWGRPEAGAVLAAALGDEDAPTAALAARGLAVLAPALDDPLRTACRDALLAAARGPGAPAVRSAACRTWATCFAAGTPEQCAALVGLTRDGSREVAATAVGLLDRMASEAGRRRVRALLAAEPQTLLTARAARVAGALGLDDQAERLVQLVYHGSSADVQVAAAFSLGALQWADKLETLDRMLRDAAWEPGSRMDLAVMAAMAHAVAVKRPAGAPALWLRRLGELARLPTDLPDTRAASREATTRQIILSQQPMVASEAAVLLSRLAPETARPLLWLQLGSPLAAVRDRAAVALGRILDANTATALRAELTHYDTRTRGGAAIALAVAGDPADVARIRALLGRQAEHPEAALCFRGALWIAGDSEQRREVLRLAAAYPKHAATMKRIALLAADESGLERLLTDAQDPRWSIPSEELDALFQASRMFEPLSALLGDWGKGVLTYSPHADAAWREDECWRLADWYQVHRGRLRRQDGRLSAP
jgi:hypothetical protein